jgi:plastocyanin
MRAAVVLAIMLAAATAYADRGTLRGSIRVERPAKVPASTILVYVVGFDEKPASPPVVIKQVGKRFIPELVAVTAGGRVAFPNGDPFLHNVFSPTTERSFDLGSYPQGETRTRTFPRLGVLDIFCNIHPEMSATLVILPNTRFAFADANGRFEIKNVPAGTWSVFAYSRRAARPTRMQATITANAITEIELVLEEVQRELKHKNKYGEAYKDTTIYAPGS